MAETRIIANKAAYVRMQEPSVNFRGNELFQTNYHVFYNSSTNNYIFINHAYIGFPYPTDITRKRITALYFSYYSGPAEVVKYDLDFITGYFSPAAIEVEWDEVEVSYENRPRTTTVAGAIAPANGTVRETEIPISYAEKFFRYGLGIITTGNYRVTSGRKQYSGSYTVTFTGYNAYYERERPQIRVVYEDAIPTVTQPTPSSGYVDERRPNRFAWIFQTEGVTLEPITQLSARYQWKLADEPDGNARELQVGANQYIDIPPATFPTQEHIQWRVNVRSNDNIDSGWSQWFTLTTIDPSAAAVPIRPSGLYLDRAKPIDFMWRHASPSGTAQTRAELQIKYLGYDWQDLIAVDGVEQSVTIPPNTLQSGNMQWRVRTYNSQGEVGEWSQPLENVVVAPPEIPTFNTLDGTRSRPVITWQSQGQAAFRIVILREDGSIAHDTGNQLGAEREYQVPVYLDNGTHTIRLTIGNEYDYWSDWAEYILDIEAPKPEIPVMHVAPVQYGVQVSMDEYPDGVGDAIIYRQQDGDAIPIATLRLPNRVYVDYRSAGEANYYIRVIDANDNFGDTSPITARPTIRHHLLALAAAPHEVLEVKYRAGEPMQRSRSVDNMGSLMQFEGRAHPVIEYGEGSQQTFTLLATMRGEEAYRRLEDMVLAKDTLILRNPRGERIWCAIQAISTPDDTSQWFDVEIPCVRVDVNEVSYFA